MSNFKDFNLDEKILSTLTEIGYEKPTPIQEQTIPKVLEGLDLIASAQTGTGKTAAFMLPALQILTNNASTRENGPRVLVLVPTRELAMQVASEAQKFSKRLSKIRTVCIYGGVPYPIQKRELSRPHDILVATPGRLIDHVDQGRIDLSNIKLLILDEADRMLDMGFIHDVETIASETPENRQTLLFSATLERKIISFSKKLQKNPVEIRIEQDLSLKSNIEQRLYYADNIHHKMELLSDILEKNDYDQALIFTSTKNQASKLAEDLEENGYYTAALHGDMDQNRRTRTINKLRTGKIQILVATDVAARGIDIATITHVINFDLPFQPEDFVHRIGRTGRAGASGIAITFSTYRESAMLSRITKVTGKPMEVHVIEGLEPKTKEVSRRGAPEGRQRGRPSFNDRNRRFPSSRDEGDRFSSPRTPGKSFSKPSFGERNAPTSRTPGKSFSKPFGYERDDNRSERREFKAERSDFRGERNEPRSEKNDRGNRFEKSGRGERSFAYAPRADKDEAPSRNGFPKRKAFKKADGKRSDNFSGSRF